MADAVQSPHKLREQALVTLLGVGLVAVAAAVLFVLLPGLPYARSAPGLLLVGLVALAASHVVSFEVPTLRWITRGDAGETRYEQLKRSTRLKVGVLLLALLVLWSGIVLLTAVLSRFELAQVALRGRATERVLALHVLALALAILYTHFESLRVSLGRDRSGLRRAYNLLGAMGAVAASVLAVALPLRGGLGPFQAEDGGFFHLAALALLGLTLFVTRSLPTPYGIFGQEERLGHAYFSRSKSVALPTFIAFGLLFVLLLLFLVVGFGVTRRVQDVFQSTLVLLLLGILAIAVVLSFAASFFLARQQDKPVLYRRLPSHEERVSRVVLWGSLGVATVLFLAALLVARRPGWGLPASAWIHFFTVGVLVLVGPIGFYQAHQARRVRRIEERFPDFLRDLASSHKGGLTMPAAVFTAAKGDYGELTPDIQKFADQLSWNVAFEEALERFAERVHTPIVERTVSLILEASRSGGNTTDVLLAASRDAREIKHLEAQRRLSMSLYTAVIYITFAVFLVVVAIMSVRFVPQIIAASESALEQGATGVGGLSFRTPSEEQFRTFYFMAALVQGLGDGIVAGMMGSGRFVLGLRHSFIMVLIAYLTFTFWL